MDRQRRCQPGGDGPIARCRATSRLHSGDASADRIPARVLCGTVQDPDALGRRGHGALLPRQRREDAARCRGSLSAVLQLHGRTGPGWFTVPRRSHHADRRRR